jgi:HEAT repeat protein
MAIENGLSLRMELAVVAVLVMCSCMACQPANHTPINALAREEQFRVLLRALNSTDPEQRRVGAAALGSVEPSAWEVIPDLVNSLRHDADAAVRVNAIRALRRIDLPDDEVIAALGRALGDEDPEVTIEAAKLLGDMGRAAGAVGPELVAMLDSPDPAVQLATIDAIADLHKFVADQAEPSLRTLLDDPDIRVAFDAAGALRTMDRGQGCERVYLRMLELNHRPESALMALAGMGPETKDAIPAVLRIADEDSEYRKAGIEALGVIGFEFPQALATIAAAFFDQDPDVRKAGGKAIERMSCGGKESIPRLLAILKGLIREHRALNGASWLDSHTLAREVLSTIDSAAARALLQVLGQYEGDEDSEEYAEVRFLTRSSRDDVTAEMLAMFKKNNLHSPEAYPDDWDAWADLAVALSHNGRADEVVPMITPYLVGGNLPVRNSAMGIIGAIGRPAEKAIPALLAEVVEEQRHSVIWVLGEIGVPTEAAVAALFDEVTDSDGPDRWHAAFLLTRLMSSEQALADDAKIARQIHDRLFSLLTNGDEEMSAIAYRAFMDGGSGRTPGVTEIWAKLLEGEGRFRSLAIQVLLLSQSSEIQLVRPMVLKAFKKGDRYQPFFNQLLRKIDGRSYSWQDGGPDAED